MTNWIFSWGVAFVLLIPEIFFGNWGFFIPLSGACILYFSVTTSWKNALVLAVCLGLALDGLYARSYPVATPLLASALLFSRKMLPEAIRGHGVLSALCSGALYAIWIEIMLGCFSGAAEVRYLDEPFVVFARTAGFLLFVFLTDGIAGRIGATPYCIDATDDAPAYHGGRRVPQSAVSPEKGNRQ